MTTLDPERTAIVVVHLQDDFVGARGIFAGVFHAEVERVGVLPKVARIAGAARLADVKVIYTRVAFQPGHTDLVTNSPHAKLIKQANLHLEGTPGTAIVDDVKPEVGDVVLTHQRIGAFHGTQLDIMLRGFGIDTLVFCGVATNVSIESTARTAIDIGYRTLIVADACATATEAAHDATLASLAVLAEIVTVDELLAALPPHPVDS